MRLAGHTAATTKCAASASAVAHVALSVADGLTLAGSAVDAVSCSVKTVFSRAVAVI